jgi:hypothetical protein
MLKSILASIGAGVAGIFLLIFGFKEFRETGKLASEGKKTTGEVTAFEEKSGRKGRVKYYLTVHFKTENGQTVDETAQVKSEIYSDAVHSKKAPVVYLPTDPHVCRFCPEVSKDFTGMGIGAFLVGASIFGLRRKCVG